jgi:gliding motility-associated-like protein
MKSHLLSALLCISLILLPFLVFSQLPYSPCSPTGGKKADILGVETKYKAPGGSAPVFTIPAGTKSIVVYIASETGLSGNLELDRGDENFITVNAIIDIPAATSSGFVNYAKNTNTDGAGTNVYGWRKVPLGAPIPDVKKMGDKTPDLNNVNFSISGATLTIAENAGAIHSSYYVEYLSPTTNSLNPLPIATYNLPHGATAANTDLVIPIPAGASVISISGKGTNTSNVDLNSNQGSEEGYSNLHFNIDLQKALTNGFVTLANGGTADRRSTYVVSNMPNTSTASLLASGVIEGDYTGKNVDSGAVGIHNPQIYVSGSDLIIRRDADYARDFDDSYVIEFYTRVGQGISAEFIDSDIRFINPGSYPASGITRTFKIPSGTNFIYFNETANALNLTLESNENPLAAYALIDLETETATGYYYQQVGSSLGSGRRDDNYAFKDVPLDSTGTSTHVNTVGFKGGFAYDLSFKLSADKSELIVTNKTGLAGQTYQFLLSAEFFGARPDVAFNAPNITFTKGASCDIVKASIQVCNPGAGNNNGGMPIAFYQGDPTVNPAAKLLYLGTIDQAIKMGECKNFTFDLDLSAYDNLNVDLTMILNDKGSYVLGGIGTAVGTPFSLASLAAQDPFYTECYYDNNIFTTTINVNNCPVLDPDPDNSSGSAGTYSYLNYYTAGSSTAAKIADTDLKIIDPDGGNVFSATITLTNTPDAGKEGLYVDGTLPAGITVSGNSTDLITLSGAASVADYIAAIQMIGYRNSHLTPDTDDRVITTVLNDGTENGPVAQTTIRVLTTPRINVTGNGKTITDNSTGVYAADGTDFGNTVTAGTAITHTFTVENTGTGILQLTAAPAVSISGNAGFTVAAQPAITALDGGVNTPFTVSFDPAGQQAGTYTAIITIPNTDADADKADYTFVVSATVNNLPVVADGGVSSDEDNTLRFTAADFTGLYTDLDGATLHKIRIISLPQHGDFQLNGILAVTGQEISAADLEKITFVPAADWNGVTDFEWVAADNAVYATTSATMTVNIAPVNDAPAAAVPATIAVREQEPAALNGISFTDRDAGNSNVTATISVPEGTVAATSGAGVTVSGNATALILTGAITDINAFITANNLTYTSIARPAPSVTLSVHISDNGNTGAGGTLEDTEILTLQITSLNAAPTGTGDSRTTARDTPVDGAVTGTDPDADALTYTKGTDPLHGTVIVNADGTYTYTPAAGYSGTDNFTVIISDGKGGSTTVTVNITVTAVVVDDPLAVNDKGDTKANTPVTVDVLENDNAGNSSLDKSSVEIIIPPAHGTVEVNEAGTVTFTPDPGYTGEDIFTYRVKNAHGQYSNVANVHVTVTMSSVNVPNLFTPNGDGRNDYFEIRGLNQYAENELVIVNRWGNEVYRQKGYQNNWTGEGLSEGTYYYLLRLRRNSNAAWEVMKGYVTLVRAFNK